MWCFSRELPRYFLNLLRFVQRQRSGELNAMRLAAFKFLFSLSSPHQEAEVQAQEL
jgi:hypothetical protein